MDPLLLRYIHSATRTIQFFVIFILSYVLQYNYYYLLGAYPPTLLYHVYCYVSYHFHVQFYLFEFCMHILIVRLFLVHIFIKFERLSCVDRHNLYLCASSYLLMVTIEWFLHLISFHLYPNLTPTRCTEELFWFVLFYTIVTHIMDAHF